MAEGTLAQKIRSLPPAREAKLEDFVDFLTTRDQDLHFTQAFARLSEEAFHAVWDYSEDAEYDRLSSRRRCLGAISVYRSNGVEEASGGSRQRGRVSAAKADVITYRLGQRHLSCLW
ncbi:MAG: hypothetical protein ACYC6M_14860 [Terriglobales bacterium]